MLDNSLKMESIFILCHAMLVFAFFLLVNVIYDSTYLFLLIFFLPTRDIEKKTNLTTEGYRKYLS